MKKILLFFYLFLKDKNKKLLLVRLDEILFSNTDVRNHPVKVVFSTSHNDNHIIWNDDQMKLKEVINNGGFKDDGTYPLISITRDNIIMNGNHRLICLKKKYGGEHKIRVNKVNMDWHKVVWIKIILSVLTSDKLNKKIKINFSFKDIFKKRLKINKNYKSKKDKKIDSSILVDIIMRYENNVTITTEECVIYIDKWNIISPPNYKIIYSLK